MSNVCMFQQVSIKAIKRAYLKANPQGPWFDQRTMSFFDSRLSGRGWRSHDGMQYYFASSERPPGAERGYSVRMLDLRSGRIETVGPFMAYPTLIKAKSEARKLAKLSCTQPAKQEQNR
jgi:hypothetical protein